MEFFGRKPQPNQGHSGSPIPPDSLTLFMAGFALAVIFAISSTSSVWAAPKPAPKPAAAPKVPQAGEKGWQLGQMHYDHKAVTILIGAKAVKIIGRSWDWGALCKAPNWDAVCYDKNNKKICTVPYSQWSKQGFPAFGLTYETAPPPKDCVARPSSRRGVATLVKVWEAEAPTIGIMYEPKSGSKRCVYTLTAASAIETAPQAKLFLRQFFELPEIDGVPLEFTTSTQPNMPVLSTREVKPVQFSAGEFVAPTGLKVLRNYTDVFTDEQDKQKIEDAGAAF